VVPGEVFLARLSNPDWKIGPVWHTRFSAAGPPTEHCDRPTTSSNSSTRNTSLPERMRGAHPKWLSSQGTLRASDM